MIVVKKVQNRVMTCVEIVGDFMESAICTTIAKRLPLKMERPASQEMCA